MSSDDDTAPRKGFDISKLNLGVDPSTRAVGDAAAKLKEKTRSITEALREQGVGAEMARITSVREEMERVLPGRALQEQIDAITKPFGNLHDRMATLGAAVGPDSSIGRLAEQIGAQQSAVDRLRGLGLHEPPDTDAFRTPETFSIPEITIPPNPLFETNERLERIEERFEQMQDVATNAAQIATGLQAASAEFLQKFETAASDNDRAAGRAIWIGVIAVFIAIAMPAAQIIYSDLRRSPDSGPALQAALEEMRTELSATREAQTAASNRLNEAIAQSNGETAAILRDIRDLLPLQGDAISPAEAAQD